MRKVSNVVLKGAFLALFCFLGFAFAARAGSFPTEKLEIHRQDGRVLNFVVELATNNAEREEGLMNRDEMAADHGMLFDFGVSRPVYMWMKNTYLPLDMLFVDDKGRITHIREDTLPLSEDIIDSHGQVRFVLEINAGVVKAQGIREGDMLTSPQIALSTTK
jgi:uncharacterized membrane protein (UPF0127 family)